MIITLWERYVRMYITVICILGYGLSPKQSWFSPYLWEEHLTIIFSTKTRCRGRGILKKLSLCFSIVYYYNGAQRYEQFLQVSRLYQALILLGLAPCLPSACVTSVLMVL